MEAPRLTNKRLVKYLMDKKGIDYITISVDKIAITVSKKFKPIDGENLVREIGHTKFYPTVKDGKNILILERY